VKAVILAGGFGTRLRPLTINVPKPMVPFANRPMMLHIIRLLKNMDSMTWSLSCIISLMLYEAILATAASSV